MRIAWREGLAAAVLGAAVGCGEPGYVLRLGWNEARILWRREPIPALLARPGVEAGLRERLALVMAARGFARDRLGLRVGESFTSYAAVGDDTIVHVLGAARRDRLEAVTWWYPVVGRVPYRGFFAREAAERAARRLEADGLDTDVRPAVAFSTLGWFADPLLSTVAGEPVAVVETVLHELFHQTLFVAGAIAFNESAATVVGHRGAIAFFCDGPGADAGRCRAARARWATERRRAAVLEHLRVRLERLYAGGPPPARRERARRALAGRAGATLERHGLGHRTELVPPNNARFLGALVYATDLGALDAVVARAGDPGGGIAALVAASRGADDPFAAVRAVAALPSGAAAP